MKIYAQLAEIQHQMQAPKNKMNTFGKYKYRTAEGIISAFKSLGVAGSALICTDTMQEVAGQIFVTATATLYIDDEHVSSQGHAMHPLEKKGMDASQITGTASSYARKYALNGLFAIEDESQDVDSMDNREQPKGTSAKGINEAKTAMLEAANLDALKAAFMALPKDIRAQHSVIKAKDARKAELELINISTNADLGGDEIPHFPNVGDGSDAGAQ